MVSEFITGAGRHEAGREPKRRMVGSMVGRLDESAKIVLFFNAVWPTLGGATLGG
jgi:hypothetical protein